MNEITIERLLELVSTTTPVHTDPLHFAIYSAEPSTLKTLSDLVKEPGLTSFLIGVTVGIRLMEEQ